MVNNKGTHYNLIKLNFIYDKTNITLCSENKIYNINLI